MKKILLFGLGSIVVVLVVAYILGKIEKSEYSTHESAKIQISAIGFKIKEFRRHCGRYPSTNEGLKALIHPPQPYVCKHFPKEGLIEGGSLPKDPWNKSFSYELNGSEFRLWTNSPDGKLIVQTCSKRAT